MRAVHRAWCSSNSGSEPRHDHAPASASMQQRRSPEFLWHSHPGPVIVNVTKGELVYEPAEDCSRRSYPAGTAFVDPGHGHVHSAFNPTDEEAEFVATFFEAPAQGPLLIPAQAPKDCDI
jgi:redox-sensitive bicupin YhaK (pirin superfamily)